MVFSKMKLLWVTDPHLDIISHQTLVAFVSHLKTYNADGLLITGDISNGRDLRSNLVSLAGFFRKPIYYVLGNHDYYYSSVEVSHQLCQDLYHDFDNLFFLDSLEPISLTDKTALVGSGGFYDARAGSQDSEFQMSDFSLIEDLKTRPYTLRAKCLELAELMASYTKHKLLYAAGCYDRVLFATHVPPFSEASWHNGARSSSESLPWFTNLTFGQMLSEVASTFIDTQIDVVCGHTHSSGEYTHFPNLKVSTGSSQYHYPSVYKVLEVD